MPDPDLEIRGEGTQSSIPLDKGGGVVQSPKKFFFGPQFGLKIRGGGPPGPLPWIRHWWHIISIEFKNIYGDQSGEFVGGYWA